MTDAEFNARARELLASERQWTTIIHRTDREARLFGVEIECLDDGHLHLARDPAGDCHLATFQIHGSLKRNVLSTFMVFSIPQGIHVSARLQAKPGSKARIVLVCTEPLGDLYPVAGVPTPVYFDEP